MSVCFLVSPNRNHSIINLSLHPHALTLHLSFLNRWCRMVTSFVAIANVSHFSLLPGSGFRILFSRPCDSARVYCPSISAPDWSLGPRVSLRYCGEFDNAAAMMIVNKDLMISFKVSYRIILLLPAHILCLGCVGSYVGQVEVMNRWILRIQSYGGWHVIVIWWN